MKHGELSYIIKERTSRESLSEGIVFLLALQLQLNLHTLHYIFARSAYRPKMYKQTEVLNGGLQIYWFYFTS